MLREALGVRVKSHETVAHGARSVKYEGGKSAG